MPDRGRKVQVAEDHQDRNRAQAERQLVADHLRSGTNATEKRVFGIRGPARDDNSVNADRGDREDIEDADVDVGDDHLLAEKAAAKWNDGQGADRRNHRETRSNPEVELVHVSGNEVLLEQELHGVCDGLAEATQPQMEIVL